MREEIHRLHGSVRKEWTLVLALNYLCGRFEGGIHISIFSSDRSFIAVKRVLEQFIMIGRAFYRALLLIFYFKRLSCFQNLPGGFSYHGDIVLKGYHVNNARH